MSKLTNLQVIYSHACGNIFNVYTFMKKHAEQGIKVTCVNKCGCKVTRPYLSSLKRIVKTKVNVTSEKLTESCHAFLFAALNKKLH